MTVRYIEPLKDLANPFTAPIKFASGLLLNRYKRYLDNIANNFGEKPNYLTQAQTPTTKLTAKEPLLQNQKPLVSLDGNVYKLPTSNKETPKLSIFNTPTKQNKTKPTQTQTANAFQAFSSAKAPVSRATAITNTTSTTQTTDTKEQEPSLADLYKKELKKLFSEQEKEINKIKSKYDPEISELTDKITELRNKRDDLIYKIQRNPYLSQATIRGRIAQATDLYNKQINNLLSELQLKEAEKNSYINQIKQAFQTKLGTTGTFLNLKDKEKSRAFELYKEMLKLKNKKSGGSGSSDLDLLVQAAIKGNLDASKLTPTLYGKVIGRLTQMGYKYSIPDFASAYAVLDSIEQLIPVLKKNKPGMKRFITGAELLGGAITQNNKDAALLRTTTANLSLIARAMGEKGVLSDSDIERIRVSIPTIFDTYEIAEAKLNRIRNILQDAERKRLHSFTKESPQAKLDETQILELLKNNPNISDEELLNLI